jgi:hypothetical protein
MPCATIAGVLRRFCALPLFQRKLVLCALVLHAAVVLLLAVFSFRRVRQLLSVASRSRICPRSGTIGSEHVVRAVKASSRCLRGAGTCLTESLTAAVLLRSLGISASVAIGVLPPRGSALSAHAWVESCGAVVYGTAGEFTALTVLEQA